MASGAMDSVVQPAGTGDAGTIVVCEDCMDDISVETQPTQDLRPDDPSGWRCLVCERRFELTVTGVGEPT